MSPVRAREGTVCMLDAALACTHAYTPFAQWVCSARSLLDAAAGDSMALLLPTQTWLPTDSPDSNYSEPSN